MFGMIFSVRWRLHGDFRDAQEPWVQHTEISVAPETVDSLEGNCSKWVAFARATWWHPKLCWKSLALSRQDVSFEGLKQQKKPDCFGVIEQIKVSNFEVTCILATYLCQVVVLCFISCITPYSGGYNFQTDASKSHQDHVSNCHKPWGAVGFTHGTTSAGNVVQTHQGFSDKTWREGPELQRISGLLGIWGVLDYWLKVGIDEIPYFFPT